jgi:hypothetical protein
LMKQGGHPETRRTKTNKTTNRNQRWSSVQSLKVELLPNLTWGRQAHRSSVAENFHTRAVHPNACRCAQDGRWRIVQALAQSGGGRGGASMQRKPLTSPLAANACSWCRELLAGRHARLP